MTGFTAVLLYAVWMLVLMLMYAFPRVPLILAGKKTVDAYSRSAVNTDLPVLMRASHAHANCVENFPIFAAVVVIAALLQKSAVVDALAAYVLYARVAQSVTHLIGANFPLVLLRATFFLAQVAMIFCMIWQLLH